MIRVYALYGRSRRVLGVLLSTEAAQILFTSVRFHYVPAYCLLTIIFSLPMGNGRDKSRQVRDDRSHLKHFGMQPVLAEQRVSADPTPPLRASEIRQMPCFFGLSARSMFCSFGPIP